MDKLHHALMATDKRLKELVKALSKELTHGWS